LRIDCLHGFFKFYELAPGQISRFMSLFGFTLVKKDDFYTFETLADAPEFSLEGGTYLGATSPVTFEGQPNEVMRANSLVYDFNSDQLVDINTITQRVEIGQGLRYYVSNGLVLPGSLTDEGLRVMDYSAFFAFDQVKFRYSEFQWLD
jgi:hypothetical protein